MLNIYFNTLYCELQIHFNRKDKIIVRYIIHIYILYLIIICYLLCII